MRGLMVPWYWLVVVLLAALSVGVGAAALYFRRRSPSAGSETTSTDKRSSSAWRGSALLETVRVIGVVLGFVALVVVAIKLLLPNQWLALTSNGLSTDPKTQKTVGEYHQPLWTYLATATVPLLGGMVALYQYNRGHQQKEEQFAQEQRAKRFSDIQVRFGSTDRDTRAVAAHQLAEIAQERSGDEYPFFIPVAKQLATKLHMEQDKAVRKTVSEGLIDLTKLAVEQKKPELARDLIHRVAEANRTAQETLAGAMGEFRGMFTEEEWSREYTLPDGTAVPGFFYLLDPLTRLDSEREIAEPVLVKLMERSEFSAGASLYSSLREAQPETERTVGDNERRSRLQGASVCLLDTIRVLSECIGNSKSLELEKLNLRSLVLVGADLSEANLIGANLGEANLRWAYLIGAYRRGANLIGADLIGADLIGAHLRGAHLGGADLIGADLRGAHLGGAHLGGADLSEASNIPPSITVAEFGRPDEMNDDTRAQLITLMQENPDYDWRPEHRALRHKTEE